MNTPEILTVEEAAGILRISERTVYELLQSGQLPGKKVGGQWRITREQLFDYFKKAQ